MFNFTRFVLETFETIAQLFVMLCVNVDEVKRC